MPELIIIPDGFATKFDEGFRKYGHGIGRLPTPDWYWGPQRGAWIQLPTKTNDVSDQGWPEVPVGPGEIAPKYETLHRQWFGLSSADRPYAFWDPGRGRWMKIAQRNPPNPAPDTSAARISAIRAAKATVLQLRTKGYIGPDTLRAVEDALDKELAR